MELDRSCGILLHITSLPGRYGIGTLGPEAFHFADLLRTGHQRYWQIFPLGPISAFPGYSPYASTSTFAGNILLISLEALAEAEWCSLNIDTAHFEDEDFVDFARVVGHKLPLLQEATEEFFGHATDQELAAYERFCAEEARWLEDYALFAALAEHFGTNSWLDWDRPISLKREDAVATWSARLKDSIRLQKFAQYIFFQQWDALRNYCRKQRVKLIGDIPIYVPLESADVWAHPEVFQLDDRTRRPLFVAGVPPDYFSATGQRWGNPLYRWEDDAGDLAPATLAWWTERVAHLSRLVDVTRVDHFRGFESYWSIPADEETALNGRWIKGPGIDFFNRLRQSLGDLPLIAEDLGEITPAVEQLRDELRLPGMKILQFAFDLHSDNDYLPHSFTDPNCIVYTGTHDNNTSNGWFYGSSLSEEKRRYILTYLGDGGFSDFHLKFNRQAYRSIARLAMLPAQDVLGYGGELRMNVPGVAHGNWRWKLRSGALGTTEMEALGRMARMYNRVPPTEE